MLGSLKFAHFRDLLCGRGSQIPMECLAGPLSFLGKEHVSDGFATYASFPPGTSASHYVVDTLETKRKQE